MMREFFDVRVEKIKNIIYQKYLNGVKKVIVLFLGCSISLEVALVHMLELYLGLACTTEFRFDVLFSDLIE